MKLISFNKIKKQTNFENYLSKGQSKLLLLLCLIGIIPPALSSTTNTNVFEKFITIIENPFSNIIFLISTSILVYNIIINYCYNINIYTRCTSQKQLIKQGMYKTLISVIMIYIIFMILSLSASILFSFGNYQLIEYEKYKIPIIYYLIFKLLKNITIYCLVGTLIYLLFLIIKKNLNKVLIILFLILTFFFSRNEVTRIIEMPLVFSGYLINTIYSSFLLEILTFVLYSVFSIVIVESIYYFLVNKRGILYENTN